MQDDAGDISIVFDLGGVLIDWNPRYLFKKVFDGDEAEMAFFLEQVCTPEWNSHQDRDRTIQEAVEERVEKFPAYEPFIRLYYSRWEEMISGPIEGTVRILESLHKRGYHLAALSNWSAETLPRVVGRFPFLKYFDPLVISGEVGLIKPDPAIFEHLLGKMGRKPGECIFIDDSPENIQAASQLGFQAVGFTSPKKLQVDLKALGIHNGRIKIPNRSTYDPPFTRE